MARFFSFRPGLELRGRQFKWLRGFSGKPLHPPLTDVTVGAYVIGPALDVIAFLFGGSEWASDLYKAGGYVLLFGAVSSLVTVLTGFADWLAMEKGTQIRRMINAHAWTMVAMTAFVVADLLVRYLAEGYYGEPRGLVALLGLVILALVTIGGTLGGSLTYDWGFNVEIARDHPVYHPGEPEYVHPHDQRPSAQQGPNGQPAQGGQPQAPRGEQTWLEQRGLQDRSTR